MPRTARLGTDGDDVESGAHVCGLFFGWLDRDELMARFFRRALRGGDHCVVVTDRADPAPVLANLGTTKEVAGWLGSGQLQVRTSDDQPRRDLDHDDMLAIVKNEVDAVRPATGTAPLRIGGEVSWWKPMTSTEDLARYELELNRRIDDDVAVLCLYDLSRFPTEAIVNAVLTHPQVLVGGRIVDNPWYTPPEVLEAGAARRTPSLHDIAELIDVGRPTDAAAS